MVTKNNRVNKMTKLYSIHIEFIEHYNTILYCKVHIQMTGNNSTINVVTKNNIVTKMTKLHSRQSEFKLQYKNNNRITECDISNLSLVT